MKCLLLVALFSIAGFKAQAATHTGEGAWNCAMTANYRMFTNTYWGDDGATRADAYALAMQKCHHEATIPSNCHVYGCYQKSTDIDSGSLSGQ